MEEAVIRTEKLVHTYPTGVTALREIDLSIYRNDKVSIVGQNGRERRRLCGISTDC